MNYYLELTEDGFALLGVSYYRDRTVDDNTFILYYKNFPVGSVKDGMTMEIYDEIKKDIEYEAYPCTEEAYVEYDNQMRHGEDVKKLKYRDMMVIPD